MASSSSVTDRPPDNRVQPEFWDDFHGDLPLPARPDPHMPFERCMARTLERHAAVAPGQRILEVGCAPARWLIFYAERFGAAVEGIEYTSWGAELSRRNLELCNVEGDIHEVDFFEVAPTPFDLILSLGFIEHFDDLERALSRHVEFMAPTGQLVIGVPNYRGVNRWLQRLSDPQWLSAHNVAAMEPELYARFAKHYGLTLTFSGHVGGFDPAIIKYRRRRAALPLFLEAQYRRVRVADRINHPLASSYYVVVMRR